MTKHLLFLSIIFSSLFSFAQKPSKKVQLNEAIIDKFNSHFYQSLAKRASDSIPSLGSLLVWQKGKLVCSQYFNDANDSTVFSVKSVTKSVMSALTGVVYDRGLLPPLNNPVLNIFPECANRGTTFKDVWYPDFLSNNDELRKTLTLKNLLTMQTGFLWDDNNPLIHRPFQTATDPVRFILDLPFETSPGEKFRYCTPSAHLVSAVLCKAVKTDLRKYADSLLFKPAGISIAHWSVDPSGTPAGGSEMYMTALNMMKFGLLYLHGGNANGKQIISKNWVKESTAEQIELNEWDVLPGANGYGYFWWRRITNGHQAIVASGYGGQLICIVPDLDMVIVTTCFVNENNRGRSEIKRLHGFIDEITKWSSKTE